MVFDEIGAPCTVTVVHPVLLGRDCYRITFSDGSSVVADADHLWQTSTKAERAAARRLHTPQPPRMRLTPDQMLALRIAITDQHAGRHISVPDVARLVGMDPSAEVLRRIRACLPVVATMEPPMGEFVYREQAVSSMQKVELYPAREVFTRIAALVDGGQVPSAPALQARDLRRRAAAADVSATVSRPQLRALLGVDRDTVGMVLRRTGLAHDVGRERVEGMIPAHTEYRRLPGPPVQLYDRHSFLGLLEHWAVGGHVPARPAVATSSVRSTAQIAATLRTVDGQANHAIPVAARSTVRTRILPSLRTPWGCGWVTVTAGPRPSPAATRRWPTSSAETGSQSSTPASNRTSPPGYSARRYRLGRESATRARPLGRCLKTRPERTSSTCPRLYLRASIAATSRPAGRPSRQRRHHQPRPAPSNTPPSARDWPATCSSWPAHWATGPPARRTGTSVRRGLRPEMDDRLDDRRHDVQPGAQTPHPSAAQPVPQPGADPRPLHRRGGAGSVGAGALHQRRLPQLRLFLVGEAFIPTHNTVAGHTLLVQASRYGWPVWVVDGKSVEFLAHQDWPNVQVVATSIQEQVAVIHRAWELMEHRYTLITSGRASVKDFTPLLLFIDEWADFRGNLTNWYAEVKVKGEPTKPPAFTKVSSLARKGRTSRVHLVFGTQRPDAEYFGGDMRDNFRARISMGRLSPQGAMMMWENPAVGVSLPRGKRGRGTAIDDDNRPVEVQVYLTPNPGDVVPGSEEAARLELLRPAAAQNERLLILPPRESVDPDTGDVAQVGYYDWAQTEWGLAADHPGLDPVRHRAMATGSGRDLASPLTMLGVTGTAVCRPPRRGVSSTRRWTMKTPARAATGTVQKGSGGLRCSVTGTAPPAPRCRCVWRSGTCCRSMSGGSWSTWSPMWMRPHRGMCRCSGVTMPTTKAWCRSPMTSWSPCGDH